MKKFKLPILVLIAVGMVASFNSCRKGEEDPRITFRSRDTRVTGTWTLKEYTVDTTWTQTNDETRTDANQTSVVKEETQKDFVTVENITYDGATGVLNRKTNIKKTVFFNNVSAGSSSTGYDDSRIATATFSVKNLTVTLNEDYSFGLDYSFQQKTGHHCWQEVIGGSWTSEGALGCDTTQYDGDFVRNVTVENAGVWKWNDRETDQIEIGFEPNIRKVGIGQYTLTGYNLKTDLAASPIGTIMGGYITRLTDKEMQFKSVADRQRDWITSDFEDDNTTNDGDQVVTVENKIKTTGSRTEIWEKLEEE